MGFDNKSLKLLLQDVKINHGLLLFRKAHGNEFYKISAASAKTRVPRV